MIKTQEAFSNSLFFLVCFKDWVGLGRSSEAPQNRESQIPSESSAGQHDDCEYEYSYHGVCRSILAGKYL